MKWVKKRVFSERNLRYSGIMMTVLDQYWPGGVKSDATVNRTHSMKSGLGWKHYSKTTFLEAKYLFEAFNWRLFNMSLITLLSHAYDLWLMTINRLLKVVMLDVEWIQEPYCCSFIIITYLDVVSLSTGAQ